MFTTTAPNSLYYELCQVIPGGVNSPVRAFKGMGIPPMIASSGAGDLVYDVEGRPFIDYCGSWGALIHGHAHPRIVDAAQKRVALGSTFGITTASEERLARKICQLVPSIEKIRFVSSGTEATMSAARLARGYTNKSIVVKFTGNYHGHADFFLVQGGSGLVEMAPSATSAGIPVDILRNTVCLPYNDIKVCTEFFRNSSYKDRVAAVIIEPIAGNMGCVKGDGDFLQFLREETLKLGALLIFDEVITGFRVALGGAQELYNITPDLTCFGKIIGGGFPAAAFGGRSEIMDLLAPLGPVYQAGTLSGNPVAMEAGYETLLLLEGENFYKDLEDKAKVITEPVQEKLRKENVPACIQQVGSMFTLFFGLKSVKSMEEASHLDLAAFAQFFRYMYAHGVYIPPSQYETWFVSSVHDLEHLEITRDLILKYFD